MIENEWLIHDNIDVTDIESAISMCTVEEQELSDRSTTGENSKQFNFLSFKILADKFVGHIKKIEQDFFNIDDYTTRASWLVEGNKGSYHRLHRHILNTEVGKRPNFKDLVVVVYTDVPEKSYVGEFYFLLKKEDDIWMRTITPKRGDILIMPSTVYHGVYPQGEGLRRTINMDFKLK